MKEIAVGVVNKPAETDLKKERQSGKKPALVKHKSEMPSLQKSVSFREQQAQPKLARRESNKYQLQSLNVQEYMPPKPAEKKEK